MVNEIFEKLSALPQVEAIALGGSRANGVFDEKTKNSEEERLREEIIKFKEGKK